MLPFFYVVIKHPRGEGILARNVAGNIFLPEITHQGISSGNETELCGKAEALLNNKCQLFLIRAECEYTTARAEETEGDTRFSETAKTKGGARFAEVVQDESDTRVLIFEMVDFNSFKTPPGFVWIKREEVTRVTVRPDMPDVDCFLQDYERNEFSQDTPHMYPYSNHGWFKEAVVWICRECKRYGLNPSEVVQLTRKSEVCVLRANTGEGPRVYFKEVGPNTVVDEVRATKVLSTVMPDMFPNLWSVNRERKWLLMEDHGQTIDRVDRCSIFKAPSLFRLILTELENVQRSSICKLSELQHHKLEKIDVYFVRNKVKQLLSDDDWMTLCLEERKKMEGEAPVGLSSLKATFLDYADCVCGLISESGMPLTLVHGDLNPVSIIVSDSHELRLINLASACISYPFRDAYMFADLCNASEEDLEFYFELWKEYGSIEDMRETYNLTIAIKLLFNCVAFHRCYLNTEKSRKSVVQKASTTFAYFLSQIWEM
ncbi:Protein kinase-like protein [Gracilaria domingensis]|nr:Protein kinase-like protein [Gracilaria domingensis]